MKLSMRGKLILSMGSIASILLISCIISLLEYARMNSYVSDVIADNVRCVNIAQRLSESISSYNLDVLAVIGDETVDVLPSYDDEEFSSIFDTLSTSLNTPLQRQWADSVRASFLHYHQTASELGPVLLSDFIDSRDWFFESLQPVYNSLMGSIDSLSTSIYDELSANSLNYEEGFYRTITPSLVAIGVGILLVLMLLFYILKYYVGPIGRMINYIGGSRAVGKRYNLDFEGDDELKQLNTSIKEISNENQNLRRRIAAMKNQN